MTEQKDDLDRRIDLIRVRIEDVMDTTYRDMRRAHHSILQDAKERHGQMHDAMERKMRGVHDELQSVRSQLAHISMQLESLRRAEAERRLGFLGRLVRAFSK